MSKIQGAAQIVLGEIPTKQHAHKDELNTILRGLLNPPIHFFAHIIPHSGD
jgi:hypothetical protein